MQRIAMTSLLAVSSGAMSGALARWYLDSIIQNEIIAITFINTLGSLAIGVAAGIKLGPNWKNFIHTGVLGSFTSMSVVIILIQPNISTSESAIAIVMTFVVAPVAAGIGKKVISVGKV